MKLPERFGFPEGKKGQSSFEEEVKEFVEEMIESSEPWENPNRQELEWFARGFLRFLRRKGSSILHKRLKRKFLTPRPRS